MKLWVTIYNELFMGKLKGIIQLTGKFDGLSFYEMNGKIVVRKTGGFDGDKIKNNAIMLVLEKTVLNLRIVLKWENILEALLVLV